MIKFVIYILKDTRYFKEHNYKWLVLLLESITDIFQRPKAMKPYMGLLLIKYNVGKLMETAQQSQPGNFLTPLVIF